jgi:uncharacterized protein involved in tolerance to divalent cations
MKSIFFLLWLLADIRSPQIANDSTISWSSSEMITWSDFLGNPDSTYHTFGGRIAKAVSATGIEFDVVNLEKRKCLQLHAVFYRYESWHILSSDALLNHERGHFDLMELTARKLRMELLRLSDSCESFSLDEELDKAFVWNDSINYQYERMTVFGTNEDEQSAWRERIKKDLLDLNSYTEKTMICSCR